MDDLKAIADGADGVIDGDALAKPLDESEQYMKILELATKSSGDTYTTFDNVRQVAKKLNNRIEHLETSSSSCRTPQLMRINVSINLAQYNTYVYIAETVLDEMNTLSTYTISVGGRKVKSEGFHEGLIILHLDDAFKLVTPEKFTEAAGTIVHNSGMDSALLQWREQGFVICGPSSPPTYYQLDEEQGPDYPSYFDFNFNATCIAPSGAFQIFNKTIF